MSENINYRDHENNPSVIGIDGDGNTMCIPKDEGNRHYQEYLEWVAEGNTPDEEPEETG